MNTQPTITIHRTVYHHDRFFDGDPGEPVDYRENALEVDDWLEEDGEWVDTDDGEVWQEATRVQVAHGLLNGSHGSDFWQVESSSSAGEVHAGDNPWYFGETESLLDGTYVETEAFLSGFSADEIREIHRLCRG